MALTFEFILKYLASLVASLHVATWWWRDCHGGELIGCESSSACSISLTCLLSFAWLTCITVELYFTTRTGFLFFAPKTHEQMESKETSCDWRSDERLIVCIKLLKIRIKHSLKPMPVHTLRRSATKCILLVIGRSLFWEAQSYRRPNIELFWQPHCRATSKTIRCDTVHRDHHTNVNTFEFLRRVSGTNFYGKD